VSEEMENKRVILDVDTGIDDAISIIYLLKHPNIIVEGITTVYGNVSVEQATKNTLQIIELMGKGNAIPVAMGYKKPLFREWSGPVVHIHGENGIGNVKLPEPVHKPIEEHASDFIVRKVNKYPNQITLIFVGRLTNLAGALAKDPMLPRKVRELVIMGGAIKVPGNVTPVSEANIAGDPEAAHMVFSAGFPLTMVGLDVTMKVYFTEKHLKNLVKKCDTTDQNKKLALVVQEMLKYRFRGYHISNKKELGSPLHDPLAVGVAFHPTLVEKVPMSIEIETKGSLSYGATIADLRIGRAKNPNAQVCMKVNHEKFLKHFMEIISDNGGK
jgi:purine nucleosidase